MFSLVCVAATFLAADDEAALKSQAAALVEQLNAAALADREAAEKQLVELGPDVLSMLPAADARMPAETRQRLSRVRETLERRLADQALEPSRITIDAEDEPISSVLSKFAESTGNLLIDYRNEFGQATDDLEVTFAADNLTFWEAFDEFLDEAQLGLYPYSGEDGIAIINRAAESVDRSGRATYAGAFRIEPQEISAQQNLRSEMSGTTRFRFEVAWEPRLRPIAIQQRLETLDVVGSDGEEISVSGGGQGVYEADVQAGMFTTEIDLPLESPDRSVEQIDRFAGRLNVMIAGANAQFAFSDLQEQSRLIEKSQGAATVTFERLRRNGSVWEIRVRVYYDETSGALESHRGWIFDNPAYLINPDGQRVAHDGFETTLQNENEVGMAYLFAIDAAPVGWTFVYETPATLLTIPVDYEIKDVPLP